MFCVVSDGVEVVVHTPWRVVGGGWYEWLRMGEAERVERTRGEGSGGEGGADKGGDARGLDAAREVATRDYQREGTTTAH